MAGISIDDIERSERVRAVTDNFFFWQGRRFIALGPVLIVAAFTANADLDERLANGLLAAAAVLALIVSARSAAAIARSSAASVRFPAPTRRARGSSGCSSIRP